MANNRELSQFANVVGYNGGNIGIGTDNPVGNLEVRDSKANLIVAKDGLTVKSNSNLHTTYDMLQIGAGGALASYSTATATADTQLVHNAYRHSGGTQKYRYADTATRIMMNSPGGTFRFQNAASGSADADITFIERLRITDAGNIGIGTDNPGLQSWRSGKILDIHGGAGNVTGELHIGANRGDGVQSVGSINFYDNTQDSTHRHVAIIESDKGGDTINKRGGQLLFYTKPDNVAAPVQRLRITSGGNIGINCTPSANDLASGASFGIPKLHVLGNNSQSGAYELLARFQSGTDADNSGATIVLNHTNDRGLALQGGRGSSNRSFGAIKSIDNQGRLSNVMTFSGDGGQGVDNIIFYTGDATTTTERLRITSGGQVNVGDSDNNNSVYTFQVSKDLGTPSSSGTGLVKFKNANSTYSQDLNLLFNNSKDIIWIGGSGNGGMTWNMGNRGYIWQIGSSEKLRITSDGVFNFGHGTSTNLHGSATAGVNINGNGNSGQIIANASANRPLILGRQSDYGTLIEFFQGSNTQEAEITIPAADTFAINTAGTERLRIASDGTLNLSNGTINLGTADSSSGHINAYELMTFNIDSDNDDSNRHFTWYKNGASGGGTGMMRLNEDSRLCIGGDLATSANNLTLKHASTVEIDMNCTGGSGNNIRIKSDSAGVFTIRDHSAGADRLTIIDDGKVGINANNPSYHLDVNGSIRSRATGAGTGLLLHSNCGLTANSNLMQIWSGQNNGMSFHTNSTGDGSNERLRIHGDGYVTKSVVPCWNLRPSYNSTQTTGNTSQHHAIGWSSDSSGNGSTTNKATFLQNCTLHGSGFTYNIHNGQNVGALRVPIAGRYYVNVTYRIENNPQQGNIYVYVNGSQIARQHVEMWKHRPYMHCQYASVLNLAANDEIIITISCANANVSGRNDTVNWFSGYLIG